MRKPRSSIRVRAERVGQRSRFSRAEERTRSDHRYAGRIVRHDDSETARAQEADWTPRFHHRAGWSLLLPPRHARAALPGVGAARGRLLTERLVFWRRT